MSYLTLHLKTLWSNKVAPGLYESEGHTCNAHHMAPRGLTYRTDFVEKFAFMSSMYIFLLIHMYYNLHELPHLWSFGIQSLLTTPTKLANTQLITP